MGKQPGSVYPQIVTSVVLALGILALFAVLIWALIAAYTPSSEGHMNDAGVYHDPH